MGVLSENCAAAETARGNKTAVPPPIKKNPNKTKYGKFEKETKINPINITLIENFATFLLPNLSTTLSALNLTINCPAAPKKRAIPFIKGGVLNISLMKITDQSIPAPSINIADKVKTTKKKQNKKCNDGLILSSEKTAPINPAEKKT